MTEPTDQGKELSEREGGREGQSDGFEQFETDQGDLRDEKRKKVQTKVNFFASEDALAKSFSLASSCEALDQDTINPHISSTKW